MISKIYFVTALLTILFSINQKSNAQIPNWMWAKSVGGTGNDLAHSVAIDDSGNVYTAGSFDGTVDFDPGADTFNLTSQGILDIYIMKLDSLGNFLWAKSFGGPGTESAFAVKVDQSGNVYATGRYANTIDFDPGAGTFNLTSLGDKDVFVVKLGTFGDFVWAESVGGTGDDEAFGITLDHAGNLLVTGAFANAVDFDPGAGVYNLTSNGGWDAFILKLEINGAFIWARSFGALLGDNGNSIAVDAANNVYSTGHFINDVDFDPGAGVFTLFTNGYMDAYISKLDAMGNFVWAKNLGGTQTDNGSGIYADLAGNIYSTGNFQDTADFDPGTGVYNLNSMGNSDIYISKLDYSGKFSWAGGMGWTGTFVADYGYAVAADGQGNIYTTGSFQGLVDFNPGAGVFNLVSAGDNDAFILKLDSAGNFVWAKKIGGPYSEQAISIAFDNNNHLYVVGHFMSHTLVFGTDTITNMVNLGATADIFIAKLDSGINTTGIQTNTIAGNISVYPNPANNLLVISYPLTGNKVVTISITDITGKIIYTTTSTTPKAGINIQNFNAGVYLVQIQSDDFVATRKVIISR